MKSKHSTHDAHVAVFSEQAADAPALPLIASQRIDPLAPDATALRALIAAYPTRWLDLGTGDGRFVRHLADQQPSTLMIGLDTCYASLRDAQHRAPANVVFLVADALNMELISLPSLSVREKITFWGDTSFTAPALTTVNGDINSDVYLAWAGTDTAHTLNILHHTTVSESNSKQTLWGGTVSRGQV